MKNERISKTEEMPRRFAFRGKHIRHEQFDHVYIDRNTLLPEELSRSDCRDGDELPSDIAKRFDATPRGHMVLPKGSIVACIDEGRRSNPRLFDGGEYPAFLVELP